VADAAPDIHAEHPVPGLVDSFRGAPELTVGRMRERFGEVMDWYGHFALTIEKRSTLGVAHPLEDGLLGACAACHTAGEVMLGEDGAPIIDPDTNEAKRRPLHALQADGCMTGVRFTKSAKRRAAAMSTAPNSVERVLPINAAEGALFRADDSAIPNRGIRDLCDSIDAHSGRQRL
jgi:hypothetical protein